MRFLRLASKYVVVFTHPIHNSEYLLNSLLKYKNVCLFNDKEKKNFITKIQKLKI